MKKSGAQAGQKVAVFGVGGLGHLAIQLAKANGAEVIAVDVADDKLELARECGADVAVNAATTQVHREIKKATGGGAHVVMVTSGSRAAYEAALRSIRKAGTLAIVGIAPEPVPLSTVAWFLANTELSGRLSVRARSCAKSCSLRPRARSNAGPRRERLLKLIPCSTK